MTSKETDSWSVVIDCPACKRQATAAQAKDLRQALFLFYVIPVFYHQPTLVDCPCGASLVSKLKARDLAGLDAQFAKRYLSIRIPLVLKTMVLGGIIAWLLPVIGTVWMGIAYAWARRHSGWVRNLALALFLLSLLPTGIVLLDQAHPPRLSDVDKRDDQPGMTKLYHRIGTGLAYWETWENQGAHTIHWGVVGDRGQTEILRAESARAAQKLIADRIAQKREEGFEEIALEKHHVLLVEYAIAGMGSAADLEKRHRLEARLNETIGWTGLGHCDGGSIGSGTMEVCCYVVDFDIASKVIAADLAGTEFANLTRIYREE